MMDYKDVTCLSSSKTFPPLLIFAIALVFSETSFASLSFSQEFLYGTGLLCLCICDTFLLFAVVCFVFLFFQGLLYFY